MSRPLSNRTIEHGNTMVLYLRTWRLWRLVYWHREEVKQKRIQDVNHLTRLNAQVERWHRIGDSLWQQKTKLLAQLSESGYNYTPQ